MVNTSSVRTFIRENDQQLRYLVSHLCSHYQIDPTTDSVNDIVQEVYLKILTKGLLEKYKPNYHGHKTQLSTYIYAVIRNIIRSWKKSPECRMASFRSYPSEFYQDSDTCDDFEIILRCHRVSSHFHDISHRNAVSDDPDGLGAELRKFEQTWLPKHDKKYKLKRRRNKSVKTSGCSLAEVYRMMSIGMTSHEIAQHYGVSDMFVSYMKRDIAQILSEYGIESEFAPKHSTDSCLAS